MIAIKPNSASQNIASVRIAGRDIEWCVTTGLIPYAEALAAMEAHVEGIIDGTHPECLWLVEHPPVYTAGTSAKEHDILEHNGIPIFNVGRGGQYTYHGPGQRVVYVMLDLKKHFAPKHPDIRVFVNHLEEWIIQTLASLGVMGERRQGRVGVWVQTSSGSEQKIAALGIKVRRWVTFHGIAININPDLSHYQGIVPCGIREHGVTSLDQLGVGVDMEMVDQVLLDRVGCL